MTVGQIAFYDQVSNYFLYKSLQFNIYQLCYTQIKGFLLSTAYFKDDPKTHFTASLAAGAIATLLTQPLDVLKTRVMNSKPGEFNGVWPVVVHTAKVGPMGFFKGFIPAFVRLGPQTILTFLLLEQLRMNFGYLADSGRNN